MFLSRYSVILVRDMMALPTSDGPAVYLMVCGHALDPAHLNHGKTTAKGKYKSAYKISMLCAADAKKNHYRFPTSMCDAV